MKLTDRAIKNLKSTSKDQFISDGDGLYLRVKPSGTKTFLIRKKHNGKTTWVSIGDYPHLTLLGARQKLDSHGSDRTTVREVYTEFRSRVLARYKRPEVSELRFDNDILPGIGDTPIADLTRLDIFNKVLNPILTRGSKVMANRTLADVKHLFGYAVERGHIDSDPSALITRKSVGGREVAKDRALSFDELETFLHALLDEFHGKRGIGVTTAAALYLCVLTGQRASEVLWMMRNWRGGRLITLPPEVCKTRPHKVHLSRQSLAVLKLCRGLPLPGDHRVLSHALRRRQETFTPHDLRRTLATRVSDLGVAPHVIEKILNHKMVGVMAVYNRAEYLSERQAALELWGRKVAELRRKK